jgi:ADP-L-glycero-D-manno-heptose 6-epimerase
MKRALVTGGAGFIGSNLAAALERRGVRVVVLDNFSVGNYENLIGFNGDVIAADLTKPVEWVDRIGAVDAIFHQAACTDTTVHDQKAMMQANVEAFRNVMDFALEAGVRRVVYASSAGTYGAGEIPMKEGDARVPMNVYGFSKAIMENVAEAYLRQEPSLQLVGLRYFNVYGPGEQHKAAAASMIWQLYKQMLAGKRPRIFKQGEQFRDFIYVKDVVDANLSAVEADATGVFNVCTGKETTFNRIIEVLNEVLGTDYKPDYFENPYSFYQNQTLGHAAKATDQIGFTAKYSIEQGIKDYLGGKPEPAVAGRV